MAETVNDYNETDLGNVAPNPRGDYSETGEYEYLDLVAYAGGSYMCILAEGTVTGTAPTPGKTTEIWQEASRPGNLTPEYVALHDDVVNKAASVAEDAAQVAQNAAQIEGMKENVAALQEQTAQDALLTKENRESAAGYASAAETSRTAAGESEENVRALVNGFDGNVEEKKQSAQEEITTSRQAAINAIAAQQVLSVNAVKQEGQNAIDKTNADAEATAADRAAVAEKAATVDGQAAQVAEDKATAENYMQTAGESKKQALEAAERLKDSVDLVQKNTVDLLGKAPVIIGSATSYDGTPVEVKDSAEMQLQGLRLYGKSKQVVTTGKNLCSIKSCQLSANIASSDVIPWTKSSQVYYAFDTQNISGAKAYISIKYHDADKNIVGSNGNNIVCDGTRKTGSFNGLYARTDGSDIDLTTIEYISVRLGLLNASVTSSFIDNVIVSNDKNVLFEPYTGGKPSPSPEYPQEIVSAGENGSIGIEITGKNLLNEDKYYSAYKQTDGIYKVDNVKANDIIIIFDSSMVGKTYTASCNLNCPNTVSGVLLEANIDNEKERGNIIFTNKSGISKITFTPKTVRDNIKITYGTGKGDIIFSDFQIEAGSFATSYESYKTPSTATIPLQNGLPGIPVTTGGNYTDENGQQYICDEIDFGRGKYVQRVWKGVLDGSEDEKWMVADNEKPFRVEKAMPENMYYRTGFCNRYKSVIRFADTGVIFGIDNDAIYMSDSGVYDRTLLDRGLSKWKAYLAEHQLKVMTYLNTPIETDLSEAQIQAYKSLTTFKPTSVISNDENAQMEVEYACDTKTYIDNKLQEIAQALVASASEAE